MEFNGTQGGESTSGGPSAADIAIDNAMDNGKDTSIEGKGASFDDFDEMEKNRQDFVISKKKRAKETSDGEQKQQKEGQEQEETKQKAPTNKEKQAAPPPGNTGSLQKKEKLIKSLDGETPLDLKPSLKLKIPVDGTESDVTIQDLINNYNGKVAYDKRFTDLDKQRKDFQAEQRMFAAEKEMIGKFRELSQTDPYQAVHYALDRINADPHNFFNKFKETFVGDIDAIAEMGPEERKAYFLERENKFLKERSQTSLNRAKEDQTLREIEARIEKVRQSTGITEEEFSGAFEQLKKIGVAKPSIEQVAEAAVDLRAIGKTNQILGQISSELIKDQAVFDEAFKFIRENNGPNSFSDEEIVSTIKDALRTRATKVIEDRTPTQKAPTKKTISNEDYEDGFFSDYDN